MGQHLSQPLTSKVVTEVSARGGLVVGSSCMNGWRQGMEDTHNVLVSGNTLGMSVYDGHGGRDVSEYLGRVLLPKVMGLRKGDDIPDEELIELQLAVDKEVNSTLDASNRGSTAAIAVLIPIKAAEGGVTYNTVISNIGDSRVMLGRRDANNTYEAVQLTIDHTPSLPAEHDRVVAAGGTIRNNRVNGQLSVSRAFGDSKFKAASHLPSRQQAVTAFAEITRVTTRPGDFLILCCDGITEGGIFTCDQLISFAADRFNEGKSAKDVAAAICDEALGRGSKDNLTCIVAVLGEELSDVLERRDEVFIPGRLEAGEDFKAAYEAAAASAGYTLGEALQMRYYLLVKDPSGKEEELAAFGGGPPEGEAPLPWFEDLAASGLPLTSTVTYQPTPNEEEEEVEEEDETDSDDEPPVCVIRPSQSQSQSLSQPPDIAKRKTEADGDSPLKKRPKLDP